MNRIYCMLVIMFEKDCVMYAFKIVSVQFVL